MGCDKEFVRIFHVDDFDVKLRRFQSGAFSPSSEDGGISVFCAFCAERKSKSICSHIAQKYNDVASVPPIYWKFKRSDLPPSASIVQKTENDDDCHHNVFQMTKAQRRSIVRNRVEGDFQACLQIGVQNVLIADLIEMKIMLDK